MGSWGPYAKAVHDIPSIKQFYKRVGLTAGGMETRKHCIGCMKGGNKLGSAVLWLLAFTGGKAAWISRALQWDKQDIYSTLLYSTLLYSTLLYYYY